jgi:glycosyltransferase involved in cell wall biosynthesis
MEAVDSVRRQSLGAWELVVVDDASSDGTSRWLHAQTDERVRSLRLDEHAERSTARNRGLDATRAPYVLFLDDDDRLRPNGLESLAKALQENLNAVGAIGAEVMFDSRDHARRFPHPRWASTRQIWVDIVAGWSAPPGRTLLRRNVLIESGRFDEGLNYAEDPDVWLRMSRHGPFRIVPQVVLEKRIHAGQTLPSDAPQMSIMIRARFIDGLPAVEHKIGENVLAFREKRLSADGAFLDARYRQALRQYMSAIGRAPRMLISPLVGPALMIRVLKSLAGTLGGRRLGLFVRSARWKIRRALKHAPDDSDVT